MKPSDETATKHHSKSMKLANPTATWVLGAVFALAVLAAQPARASQFDIDPDHSTVGFKIRHLVGKVTGKFDKFQGSMEWDGKDIKSWKGTMTIDAASIDTGNTHRDDHLRTPDFFDVKTYPKITIVTKEITDATATSAKVKATITMHGVTKDVVLNLETGGLATDPKGAKHAGASLSGKISRGDFGIKWNKAIEAGNLMLGDEVDLNVELEGIQEK